MEAFNSTEAGERLLRVVVVVGVVLGVVPNPVEARAVGFGRTSDEFEEADVGEEDAKGEGVREVVESEDVVGEEDAREEGEVKAVAEEELAAGGRRGDRDGDNVDVGTGDSVEGEDVLRSEVGTTGTGSNGTDGRGVGIVVVAIVVVGSGTIGEVEASVVVA